MTDGTCVNGSEGLQAGNDSDAGFDALLNPIGELTMKGWTKVFLATAAALSFATVGIVYACPPGGDRPENCNPANCDRANCNPENCEGRCGGCDGKCDGRCEGCDGHRQGHCDGCRNEGHGHGCGGCAAHGQIEGADRTVNNTDTGVIIEITSNDPTVAAAIQARVAKSPGRHGGADCKIEGVQRTVTNTDTGAIIELTSEDATVVEAIQAHVAQAPGRCGKRKGCAGHGMHGELDGVQRTVTNTDMGVIIEITSEDPALIEIMQTRHARASDNQQGRPGCVGRGMHGRLEGVQRTVTNTDTGVIIEITSDEPAAVAVIQARFANMEGGVKIGSVKP
jgi:TusA-related sulfurtransferase